MQTFWIPIVWLAFVLFLGGSLYKLASTARLANREKTVFPTMSAKHGAKSVLHWILPFGSHNMRIRPLFTVVSFAFHICLLVTPLFAMGHAVLWKNAWGIRWWSLPPLLTDIMTLVVVAAGVFFVLRRIAAPQVRYVSSWSDFLLVLLVVAPFLTGFIAHHHLAPPAIATSVHIASGVLWLVAIPFTRLAHMLWFFLSRAYMGSEFGAVRNARDW